MRYPLLSMCTIAAALALDCPSYIPVGSVFYANKTATVPDESKPGSSLDLTVHVKVAFETPTTMRVEAITHKYSWADVSTEKIITTNLGYKIQKQLCWIIFEDTGAITKTKGEYRRVFGSSGTTGSSRQDSPSLFQLELSEFVSRMEQRATKALELVYVNSEDDGLTRIELMENFSLSPRSGSVDMEDIYKEYLSEGMAAVPPPVPPIVHFPDLTSGSGTQFSPGVIVLLPLGLALID